jgi:DNA-binding MarR family transcriptional regulator
MDRIESITAFWGPRLDLDGSGFEITARALLLARAVLSCRAEVLEEVGLSPGEFDVLAATEHMSRTTQRGAGINLVILTQAALVTSGAITKRIDRLESAGLVSRSPDPADRRGTLVSLTPEGRRVIDKAVRLVVEAEHDLIHAHLTRQEREKVVGPLTKLVAALDEGGRLEQAHTSRPSKKSGR